MGLFTGLLTLPLAPVRGVAWVAEQVLEEAQRQHYSPEAIRRELLEVELQFDGGEIDETERNAREADLLERLSISMSGRDVWEERRDG